MTLVLCDKLTLARKLKTSRYMNHTSNKKKFTDTKSLALTCQPVNTPLRGYITMSFRYDNVLKKLVLGFSLYHFDIWHLGFASASYLLELGSRELTDTWFNTLHAY